jgi:hypothetical protein
LTDAFLRCRAAGRQAPYGAAAARMETRAWGINKSVKFREAVRRYGGVKGREPYHGRQGRRGQWSERLR